MDEVTLYNLHSSSAGAYRAATDAKAFAMTILVNHMHEDHGMGVRELAKRFNVRMADIKAVLFKDSASADDDLADSSDPRLAHRPARRKTRRNK